MKPNLLPFLAIILLLDSAALSHAEVDFIMLGKDRVHPTRLLVRLRDRAKAQPHRILFDQQALHARREYQIVPGLLLLDDSPAAKAIAPVGAAEKARKLQKRIATLRASGLFEYVEPDYTVTTQGEPTDAKFVDETLWGLRNTGTNGGVVGADIGATGAWGITTGSTNVIVAVIDSGIRYTHQDLAANMWRNPDGVASNLFGINAITESGDPLDDFAHGTHVAGTIGAVANGGGPHVGVAWQVRLLACKFITSSNTGNVSDEIECINFAVANGAKIINASYGSHAFSQSEFDAIDSARNQDVLFVAAAGNDGFNNDLIPSYPASYELDNILSVAAINRSNRKAGFSNSGLKSVHLGAPGEEIFSASNSSDSAYITLDGTSMAAPHVSGVAALIYAQFPLASMTEIRQRILLGTVPVNGLGGLQGRTITGGRLNASNSLALTPDSVMEIAVSPRDDSTLNAGRTITLVARVTDVSPITNATVIANVNGFTNLMLLNDGSNPSAPANGHRYATTFLVPSNFTSLFVSVLVSAPGKTNSNTTNSYQVFPTPVNDAFADAIAIPAAGSAGWLSGSNAGATSEDEETVYLLGGGRTVWWKWTAPTNGYVTVAARSTTALRPILYAYKGNSLSGLTNFDSFSELVLSNQLTFDARVSTNYFFSIDGYAGEMGGFELSLRFIPSPTNDNFADRTLLTGMVASSDGDNTGATKEGNEPSIFPAHSVWWSWTAPTNGVTTVMVSGENGIGRSKVSGIYTNTSLTNLGLVVSDGTTVHKPTNILTFNALAGVSYKIGVDYRVPTLFGKLKVQLWHSGASQFLQTQRLTNGLVALSLSAEPNRPIVIDTSTNLVNWTPLTISSNPSGIIQIVDTNANSFGQRFYRAHPQ